MWLKLCQLRVRIRVRVRVRVRARVRVRHCEDMHMYVYGCMYTYEGVAPYMSNLLCIPTPCTTTWSGVLTVWVKVRVEYTYSD